MGQKMEAKVQAEIKRIEQQEILHLGGPQALGKLKRLLAESHIREQGMRQQIREMVVEEEREAALSPRQLMLREVTEYEIKIGQARALKIYEAHYRRKPIEELGGAELGFYLGQLLGAWLDAHERSRKAG